MKIQIDARYSPELWESMDEQRRKTGGWWAGVISLRIRFADSVLNEDDFTVVEVNVREQCVQGVRILHRGLHASQLRHGPFLLWEHQAFMEWLTKEEEQLGVKLYKEIFVKNAWAGTQAGLFEVFRAFGA